MSVSLQVVVCGGSGRIGQAVVGELLARGHRVVNLDRNRGADSPARFACVDLACREQVRPFFDGVDAVIQLAEVSTAGGSLPAEEVYAQCLRISTVVMQAAADAKVPRLIYTSSCQVYGCWGEPHVPPQYLPLDEAHPVRPQSVSALAKVGNENYARWLSEQAGLSVAIFRLPWVMTTEPTDAWWRWLESQTGPVDGLGAYVHHTDAARAYALALEHSRPGCEVYHFCADEIASIVPLRQRLQVMPGYPSLSSDWPAYRSPLLTDKARNHFGWRPAYNVMKLERGSGL